MPYWGRYSGIGSFSNSTTNQAGGGSAMTTERFINGAVAAGYTLAFGNELNGLAYQSSVLAAVGFTFDNSSPPFDTFGQIEMELAALTTGAGSPFIGFSIYPQTTGSGGYWGDNEFATPSSGEAPTIYQVGQIPLIGGLSSTVQGGTSMVFPLPFMGVKMRLVAYNLSLSGALAGTYNTGGAANSVWFRTFNIQDA